MVNLTLAPFSFPFVSASGLSCSLVKHFGNAQTLQLKDEEMKFLCAMNSSDFQFLISEYWYFRTRILNLDPKLGEESGLTGAIVVGVVVLVVLVAQAVVVVVAGSNDVAVPCA